jgi:hypothetical protein
MPLAHVKPVPAVQRSALFVPLQLGIANAVTLPVVPDPPGGKDKHSETK